jgi:hypothetical protein
MRFQEESTQFIMNKYCHIQHNYIPLLRHLHNLIISDRREVFVNKKSLKIIIIRITKNRQINGKKKKYKRTNNDLQDTRRFTHSQVQ